MNAANHYARERALPGARRLRRTLGCSSGRRRRFACLATKRRFARDHVIRDGDPCYPIGDPVTGFYMINV